MNTSIDRFLLTRPTVLDWLHRFGLARPRTQTQPDELACLARHARGRRMAVEIGTFEGVSAAVIATALATDGLLYCVDPWPEANGRPNPTLSICRRHLAREHVAARVRLLIGTIDTIAMRIPEGLDFAFIDGDHTYEGLASDWRGLRAKLSPGAIVCFHDTSIPPDAPQRDFGCRRFFDEVILRDPAVRRLETVYTLNAVQLAT